MIEFGVQSQGADRKQNECNVGVHQVSENVFLQRHVERLYRPAGQMERRGFAIETLETLTLDLPE